MDVHVVEVAPGVWHARAKHVGWALLVDGSEVTVVDTGYPGDRDRLVASLERVGRSPADVAAVVLTHGHPDHVGNAEHLRTRHGARVLAHRQEAANARGEQVEQVSEATLLKMAWRPSVLVWAFDIVRLKAARVDRPKQVDVFDDAPLDVPGAPVPIHTPGHTSGHCALHLPDRGALLVGDALMTEHALARSPGPQLLPDFFNSDPAQARTSLRRLADFSAEVLVPGHGPAFRGSPAQAVEQALGRP